jgi:hypothetical protein
MRTIEPGTYKKRPIRYLELLRVGEWRLKEYGISYIGESPGLELVAAARNVAAQCLSARGNLTNHYGFGFLGIHEGKTGIFVFVDWWADENELHHHVYVSPSDRPGDLEYKTPTGLSACVWDLYAINHEREAWVEFVLKNPHNPNLDAYLARVLNADV